MRSFATLNLPDEYGKPTRGAELEEGDLSKAFYADGREGQTKQSVAYFAIAITARCRVHFGDHILR